MDGTIIQQGSFTSTGQPQYLSVRSDIDYMWVYNYTEAGATNINHGVQYFWQRGLADKDGFVYIRPAASTALGLSTSAALAVNGFSLVNTVTAQPGNSVALTSISNAAPPRVLVGSTAGLYTGNIVRLFNVTNGQQLGGLDFQITVIDGTHFDLSGMSAIAAANAGTYRVIPFDPIFYPRRRYVSSITRAAQAVVTTTVAHGYQIGQDIRLVVPTAFGMPEINGLVCNIVAVPSQFQFTVNVNSTNFTAFAFPVTAAPAFTPAEAVPFGEGAVLPVDPATGNPLDSLTDATLNTAFIGMNLYPGITGPAGTVGQLVYWVAGKTFNGS